MNDQSPLIPQGSLVEQKNKSRARFRIAVFVVLAVHGVGLMALLMQGCKKEGDNKESQTEATNNAAMTFVEPSNAPPAVASDTLAPASNHVPIAEIPAPPTPSPGPANPDYKVAKGDTFTTIAPKLHVSVQALMDANPGVQASKLHIGQVLHVPNATVASAPPPGAGAPAAVGEMASAQASYSVKSGDSLIKIAGQFGTSVKAIRTANNLKTDRIVVGQKLKIPAKASTPGSASAPASAAITPLDPVLTTASASGPQSAASVR